jgi:hypothetical protein
VVEVQQVDAEPGEPREHGVVRGDVDVAARSGAIPAQQSRWHGDHEIHTAQQVGDRGVDGLRPAFVVAELVPPAEYRRFARLVKGSAR